MIHIIDSWYFSADGMQYVLTQRITTSKGNTIDKAVGFYTSLNHLLERLLQILAKEEIDKGNIETISDYISSYNEIAEKLNSIVKNDGGAESAIN